ncbi:hypothetical protein BG004_000732 [Podila humilis]|nr:hypothetical protein BG004_000732 [Podila humilis]
MTAFILKVASALAALVFVAQAVPHGCVGGACHQAASSGSVSVGSTTNIQPVTNVVPITRYQPVVQSFAPIVQSACGAVPLSGHHYPGGLSYRGSAGGFANPGFMGMRGCGMASTLPLMRRPLTMMNKRAHKLEKELKFRPDCVPSATDSCLVSLDSGTTDLGSNVYAKPENIIKPTTIYQDRVKSQGPEIESAPAMHSALSQSHVILDSLTKIQPETHVSPEVTYQPEVENKQTIIESESQDASLDRSSASLGSLVTIRPVVKVEPVTTFKPKVTSLPFVIKDYGCGHRAPATCGCV